MNKIFMAIAAIFSSGIFAYVYLKTWISVAYYNTPLTLQSNDEVDYPYFYRSEETYMRVTLIFGMIFLSLWIASVFFTFKKDWSRVFFVFVLSMITVLAVMINGAIK